MIDAAQHLGLAYRITNRLRSHWIGLMPREDAEGWAMLGLVKAANRYDPARGLAFSTYAGYRIAGELRGAIRREAGTHTPRPKLVSLHAPERSVDGRVLDGLIAVADDSLGEMLTALDGPASVWARWAATLRPSPALPRVRWPTARRTRQQQRAQYRAQHLADLLALHGWRREAVG